MPLLSKFAKYGGVAAGSASVDWGAFVAAYALTSDHLVAQIISRIVGGFFSFALNKLWSFDSGRTGHITVQGRRFLLLYGASYMLSISLLYLQVDFLGRNPYVSKLLADGACFLVNFAAMHLYVYRSRPGFTSVLRSWAAPSAADAGDGRSSRE